MKKYLNSIQTVCYCLMPDDELVFLAKKARKIGIGLYNGLGGKVDARENIYDSLVREVREEANIEILGMRKHSEFYVTNHQLRLNIKLHIFSSIKFMGEIILAKEELLRYKWFPYNELPANIWPSDKVYLPMIFDGKKFIGNAIYASDGSLHELNIKVIGNV